MARLLASPKALLVLAFGYPTYGLQVVKDTATSANGTITELVEGGEQNLCFKHRAVPQFFLLGTPKSGTTYFFESFARSTGIVHYKPAEHEATWHSKEPWVFGGGLDISEMDDWLSHYPQCKQGRRLVAVDCTPGYFGSRLTPAGIHKVYNHMNLMGKLVFMVFLRNPLARTHSHYYQYQDNGVMEDYFAGCKSWQFPKTFAIAVHNRIHKGSVCNCDCDVIFDDSMYVASFRRYFEFFQPSQFHVVPFNLATGDAIAVYTWKILGVSKGAGDRSSLVGGNNEKNHHSYPPLYKELDKPGLKAYKSFFESHASAKKVAKELAGSGAHLFNFHKEHSVENVAFWLKSQWGTA